MGRMVVLPLQPAIPDAPTAAAAVAIVLGVALLVYWAHQRGGSARAENWPSTTATITESVVGTEGERPHLEYEYEVDGATYENDSVWASGDTMRHQRLRSLVESNPVGSELTVYYDPDSPRASVVVENPRRRLPLLVVGVLLVLVGVGFLVLV